MKNDTKKIKSHKQHKKVVIKKFKYSHILFGLFLLILVLVCSININEWWTYTLFTINLVYFLAINLIVKFVNKLNYFSKNYESMLFLSWAMSLFLLVWFFVKIINS